MLKSGGRLFGVLALAVTACAAPEPPEEVELGVLMGAVQRFNDKLGYSIAAQNGPLALFYLEELGEALDEVLGIEEYDGTLIRQPAGIIFAPALETVVERVEEPDWVRARVAYTALVDACNRCHAATEHEFIVIKEADPEAPPPFNQVF